MPTTQPYLPGEPASTMRPLARYLPPLPQGVVSGWMGRHLPDGGWVLDPFGAAPDLAVEAARAGFRVLVAANNPIARFLLEMAAAPPTEQELRAALAVLASSRKGEERLEPHVLSLYNTQCLSCARQVSADAFVWESDAAAPIARIYTCPHCGDQGERPATEADQAQAARFSATGLHRARALERVAPLDDPDREHVSEALEVYLPRAVYALFTLLNRLDGLRAPVGQRRLLTALLISACDRGNTLWPHPVARARPRQLTIPPRYLEHNLWMALEAAVDLWGGQAQPVSLSLWPEPPPAQGGISVHEGRLRDLASDLGQVPLAAVVTALPRPNQAFWTLSALWSAWLWGHAALGPFKGVLRRRRYDWGWHATALQAAFQVLSAHLAPDIPVFGLVAEAEPGFLSAACLAADRTGLDLEGLALREAAGQGQLRWRIAGDPPQPEAQALDQALPREQALTLLRDRGEPAPYLDLHAAGLAALARAHAFRHKEPSAADQLAQTQDLLSIAFSYRNGFIRFGGSQHSLEVGSWWLRDAQGVQPPLSDRVERSLAAMLEAQPGITAAELDAALCREFPGLLTPETSLVLACLESYGEQVDDGPGWKLRPQEAAGLRSADLQEVHSHLESLGARLGFGVSGQEPMLWKEGEQAYSFFVLATAEIGEILLRAGQNPQRSFLVLPGGRANLVHFKLRRDPRLQAAMDAGWRFLKFRHVRRLVDSALLTRDTLDDQFGLDPLTYTKPQIPLL
jgi:hypothetical protein